MPPQAYALVTLFVLSSVALGWLAVRLVARWAGGPTPRAAYVLPILGAFGALYVIGHRLGLSLGPELPLFGFRVALPGDLAIGFVAAIAVALVQALVMRALGRGRTPPPARQPETGR